MGRRNYWNQWRKVVPIKINTTGTLKDGLTLKSISGNITEVGITGPEDVLRNISEIGTEEINLSEIKDSTNIEVALGIPDKISIYNGKSSINVNISIDKAKTKDFTISLFYCRSSRWTNHYSRFK